MIAAVQLLIDRGWQAPVCIAVHGLFADNSDQLLAQLVHRFHETNHTGRIQFCWAGL